MARPTSKNINELQKYLLEWYEKNGRKFPWRKRNLTNYQIVIAETLLQRTKAETVSSFYQKFINDFPNWKSLATVNIKAIEKYLRPIGLYRQRAKRFKSLAIEMQKRNGKFPAERTELEKIPFIGQYIANSIELLIFNKPRPLIDVNMSRVVERYFGKRKMADIRYDPYLQSLSIRIVNHQLSKYINWAIIDYSALVCSAKPACKSCKLSSKCIFFKKTMI